MTTPEESTGAQLVKIEFPINNETLAKYREMYAVVPDAETKEGMKVIKSTLTDLRAARAGVNKKVTAGKKTLNDAKKQLTDEGARLVAELDKIIEPHAAAKQVVEEKVKKEKERAAALERERVECLMVKIREIKKIVTDMIGKSGADIQRAMSVVQALELDPEEWGERLELAEQVKATTLEQLATMLYNERQREDERKKAAEDRKRLEEERAEVEEMRKKLAAEKEELEKHQGGNDAPVTDTTTEIDGKVIDGPEPTVPAPVAVETPQTVGETPPNVVIEAVEPLTEPVAEPSEEYQKQLVLTIIGDLVSSFLYYDRKEDEDMPRGHIERMVTDGVISVEQMAYAFRSALDRALTDTDRG